MVNIKVLAVALTILGLVPAPASDQNESAFVNYLRPTLKYVGGAARVYYVARCVAGEDALLFPAVDLKAPTNGATGIAAVRQIFQDDPNIVITQDQSGMLRLTIGSVSTLILQTRIKILTLDPNEQFSPIAAVIAVQNRSEVYAQERALDIASPLRFVNFLVSGPIEGQPHLPKLMQNVTVDEALDSVARTFKGVVLYGTCKAPDGKEFFKLDYVYGA